MATTLEYLTSIDEEADRMVELVTNLLYMSRIEARSMPQEPEVCHLADITVECVRHIERSSSRRRPSDRYRRAPRSAVDLR